MNFSCNETAVLGLHPNVSASISSHPGGYTLTLWFVLSCILHVTGILTNAAFVIAVYNDRTSQVGPRLLVGNLAVSGFLFASVGFPMVSIATLLRFYGVHTSCHYYYVFLLFLIATSWADVMLAINRVVAICFPYHYNKWKTRKVSLCLIASSWSVATTLVILVGTRRGAAVALLPDKTCSLLTLQPSGVLYTLAMNLIPYGLVGIASAAMFGCAQIRLREGRSTAEGVKRNRVLRKRLIIAKAMLLSLIWCIVCVSPINVMIGGYPKVLAVVPSLSRWLRVGTALQYALNPLFFFVISATYRNTLKIKFRNVLRPQRNQRRSSNKNTISPAGSSPCTESKVRNRTCSRSEFETCGSS